jgi:hypothetical protein
MFVYICVRTRRVCMRSKVGDEIVFIAMKRMYVPTVAMKVMKYQIMFLRRVCAWMCEK